MASYFKKNLFYIGYGGNGNQVRDVLHIDDLCNLINLQINNFKNIYNKTFTVGGSKTSYTSKISQKFVKKLLAIK